MTETSENEGALQKRSLQQYLTYAKWGLMGIGGLWVAKVAIGLVLNPIVLVGAAGVGAAGVYFAKGRSGGTEAPAAPLADTGEVVLRREAEAAAERELASVPAAVPSPASVAPASPNPTPQTPLDEFERRLVELEALKAQMDEG